MSTAAVSEAVALLQSLIAIPSFSGEEEGTAAVIAHFLEQKGIPAHRYLNNIWAVNKHFQSEKPTLLLCSHHDTVRPNPSYTRDPFQPTIENGRLYGLGSNDAGGALVGMIAAFCHHYDAPDLPYNLVLGAVAEEERSGKNGVESLLPLLPQLDCALIGEPTLLDLAVAEKGLMVLDCTASGRAGHAAREEGDSALYRAMKDIEWFRTYRFPQVSEWLGPIKMSVTSIETPNKAHNVVPDTCHFVVDVRMTDAYTPEELLEVIHANVESNVRPRSTRLRATGIPESHPLVVAGKALGGKVYGSPTSSDKALIPVPTLKVGPGDSARSHTADEYIEVAEIEKGVIFYTQFIKTTTK